MGKKKTNQHAQQSFGSMVSRAALTQLLPEIQNTVVTTVRRLGQQLAQQQVDSLETMFTRLVVLEKLAIEKLGVTEQDLTDRVVQIEDDSHGYSSADADATVTKGDRVRLEIKTKTKDQLDYQGSSRMRVDETGSGQTLGNELEDALIGMKAGETKTTGFGVDKSMTAELTVSKISRKPQVEETKTDDQAQG